MPFLPDARPPAGLRLYVVGDVHGMLDALVSVHRWIEADLAARPVPDWRVIHIGDYIDRGPDSAGVLRHLAERSGEPRMLGLLGNHDLYLAAFLADPEGPLFERWMLNGAASTFRSYGIGAAALAGDRRPLAETLAARAGDKVRTFLGGLPRLLRFGDYAFAHAGVRPGVALERQDPDDLIWIREPFLSSTDDLGAVVVHGHTPADEIEVRRNRINVDTGAVFGGRLSCLVLEENTQCLLGSAGPIGLDIG